MRNKDRILATLASAKGAICDDCLSARTGVAPRQTVFQICSSLAASNAIRRELTLCNDCGKLKKASQTHEKVSPASPEEPTPTQFHSSPQLADLGMKSSLDGEDSGSFHPLDARPWHWEGHVQSALRHFLESDGWVVTATADTESKAPGIDLVATKADRYLAVEVKGYPSTTYDHGPRRGQPKPTLPTNQARQWFSHALLGMMMLRDKRPDAEIALCFPDFQTYRTLAARTRLSFERLGFGVYFIAKDGAVRLEIPHRSITP